jgi:hypothetical protein
MKILTDIELEVVVGGATAAQKGTGIALIDAFIDFCKGFIDGASQFAPGK